MNSIVKNSIALIFLMAPSLALSAVDAQDGSRWSPFAAFTSVSLNDRENKGDTKIDSGPVGGFSIGTEYSITQWRRTQLFVGGSYEYFGYTINHTRENVELAKFKETLGLAEASIGIKNKIFSSNFYLPVSLSWQHILSKKVETLKCLGICENQSGAKSKTWAARIGLNYLAAGFHWGIEVIYALDDQYSSKVSDLRREGMQFKLTKRF